MAHSFYKVILCAVAKTTTATIYPPPPPLNWPCPRPFSSPKIINHHFTLGKVFSGHPYFTAMAYSVMLGRCFSQCRIPMPVLLALVSVFGCISATTNQPPLPQAEENVLLEELVREVRKLNDRMDFTVGRGNAEEEQMMERKRSRGIAPSVLWDGVEDKRAQLPFSGGIYGKRSPLPFSGGIYGKRSTHNLHSSSLIFPTFDRQIRAMPFNGGMYGK